MYIILQSLTILSCLSHKLNFTIPVFALFLYTMFGFVLFYKALFKNIVKKSAL